MIYLGIFALICFGFWYFIVDPLIFFILELSQNKPSEKELEAMRECDEHYMMYF